MKSSKLLIIFLAALIAFTSSANNLSDTVSELQPQRRNIFQKIYDYVASANDPKPAKKFDFSVIGGPYYSQDTKLGIGIVAAGIFRRDTTNLTIPPSQVSLYGDVSITGYFKVGIEGSNYFKGNKIWLYYDASFESMPSHYWGIGYKMNRNDANDVEYKRLSTSLHAASLFQVFNPHFYVGPVINLEYNVGRDIPNPALWNNQKNSIFTNAIGVGVSYDSRDNTFNAYKGVYARLDQLFAPKFFGNKYAFTITEATLCNYFEVWKGGVIATQLHTRLTYGDTPWSMMSELGGSKSMRGYWEGRYNDKCAADATVELRQRLFSRIGMVVWGGVGCISPTIPKIFKSHALWNAGIGLRWEFKHRVNVRVDYGFGENQNGLVFSINEAF